MGEVKFKGRRWTWENNRQGEGYIEERIDMFFDSAEWLLEYDKAEVLHLRNQSSDHSMLVLDNNP